MNRVLPGITSDAFPTRQRRQFDEAVRQVWLLAQFQCGYENFGDYGDSRQSLVLFKARNLRHTVTDSHGKFALGQAGAPAQLPEQVAKLERRR